ncbi:MAG: hypothetical protein E7542_01255 [Ruminococcaceae bacterium]|nr:hypothetical protein [Oscillospiraceae bacterium]
MEIIKKSLKLYGLCIVGSILCLVLTATFNMIGANLLGKQIGYSMQGEFEDKENSAVILYSHYYDDGEDLEKAKFEEKGYTLTEIPIKIPTTAWNIFAQFCLFCMMGIFVYNELWKLGFKDNNLVRIGKKTEDKLKGLKIGLITTTPSILLFAILIIGRTTYAAKVATTTFSFLNPYIERLIYIFVGYKGGYISQLSVGAVITIFGALLFIPLVAMVAYLLGYKSIIVSEKLIYKKK